MAYFFSTPDIYGMAQTNRARFDDSLNHLVESTLQTPARMKAAKEAKAIAEKRAAREEEWDSLLMQSMQARMNPPEQEAQQQPEQEAAFDYSGLSKEDLQRLIELNPSLANIRG